MGILKLSKGERDHFALQEGFVYLKKWADVPMLDADDYYLALIREGGELCEKYPDSIVMRKFVCFCWDVLSEGKEALGAPTDEVSPWESEARKFNVSNDPRQIELAQAW